MWTPTIEDAKSALEQWQWPEKWDWKKSPVMRLPLYQPIGAASFDPFDVLNSTRMWYVEVRIEYGHMDGRPAKRLVASVPGTDIKWIADEYVEE